MLELIEENGRTFIELYVEIEQVYSSDQDYGLYYNILSTNEIGTSSRTPIRQEPMLEVYSENNEPDLTHLDAVCRLADNSGCAIKNED